MTRHVRPRPGPRAGLTLIEMLVTLVMFTIVIGAAFGFVNSQAAGFRRMSDQAGLVQDLRFGRDLLRQEIRTAGTNVTDEQPLLVYASDSVFAFNADLTTNVEDSVRLTAAVYVDRSAPDAAVSALTVANAGPIPGASPTFTYPLADYSQNSGVFVNSDAETTTYWFAPDSDATRPGTWVLYRQVNRQPSEIVLRGVMRNNGLPFFRYWYDPSLYGAAGAALDTVPRGWLPLAKDAPRRGAIPDTGTSPSTRIDQVRAVEVNYAVTARGNTTPRTKLVSYMVPMPNTAHPRLRRACGRVPIFGGAVVATWKSVAPVGIELTWPAAVDQTSGELDAVRYVIWRREVGAATWGDPRMTIGVSAAPYTWRDVSVISATRYEYAIAVQDCTPNVSSLSISNSVLVP